MKKQTITIIILPFILLLFTFGKKKENFRLTKDNGRVTVKRSFSKGLILYVYYEKEGLENLQYTYSFMRYNTGEGQEPCLVFSLSKADKSYYKKMSLAFVQDGLQELQPYGLSCCSDNNVTSNIKKANVNYSNRFPHDTLSFTMKDKEILDLGIELFKELNVFRDNPEYRCKEFFNTEMIKWFIKSEEFSSYDFVNEKG